MYNIIRHWATGSAPTAGTAGSEGDSNKDYKHEGKNYFLHYILF